MMKLKLIVYGLLALASASCRGEGQNEHITLIINNMPLDAEVADTVEKREKGLMFRKKLDERSGMLFIFEKEKKVSFWMKNTEIPLSVAYISKSGYIREIHDLQPHSLNPVKSSHSVLYALEVNQGFFRENGISEGDQVVFP
jgi:uncharacterized protein